MLNKAFGKNFHDYFHVFAITCFGIGLPLSKVILSLSTMLLLLNLILEGNWRSYWSNLKSNKLFLWVLLFFGLHVVSLLWTDDFNFGLSDLRVKLTLLVIPLILTAKPLKTAQLIYPLLFFVLAVFLTSLINILNYWHIIGNKTYDDIRGLSLFGSHIRYGILVALAFGILLFYIFNRKIKFKELLVIPVFWFLWYTYYSQVISGVIAVITIILAAIIFSSFRLSRIVGIISVFVILLVPTIFFFIKTSDENQKSRLDYVHLEKYSAKGTLYDQFSDSGGFINGRPVYAYKSDYELSEAWKKRSKIPYESKDLKGQPVRHTLLRYMTSKDLKKDEEGLDQLKDEEIRFVEKGIADYGETRTGLIARLQGIRYQLSHKSDPNGHSLLQRLEYWETAIRIIKQNWLLGVGVGDLQISFDSQYEKDKSPLKPEYRLRAHNSYLSSWVAFGILGIVVFLIMNIDFLISKIKSGEIIPIFFILVSIATFFLEDTLETQTGVSFFAFFYGLFIHKPSINLS